jgi:outer membrane protein assembly factor BamB
MVPRHVNPRPTASRRLVQTARTAVILGWLAAVASHGGGPARFVSAAPPDDLATRAGEDWEAFLGPTANGRSGLRGIASPWPADGPPLVWQVELGEGYCPPAVARGRALVYDRVGNESRLRCLHAETGAPLWEQRTVSGYTDMFGYDGGPRAAPVIAGDRVLTFDPEGRLTCRGLDDGGRLWEVDTSADYGVVRNFFGVGAAPLVTMAEGGAIVVVPVGGSPPGSSPPAPERLDLVRGLDSGLVAFDLATGRERWRASAELAGYSSPVPARIAGADRILAWLRDQLIVVDPTSGAVQGGFRWRAEDLFSVVAANPVVRGDEVLLTEAYGPGSVLLDLAGKDPRVLRQDPRRSRPGTALKVHWATPVLHDGHLYAASGRHAGDAVLVCVDWRTGEVRWGEEGCGRASLVLVDGHLVVICEFGDLLLVRATPDRYEEISRVRLQADDGTPLLAPPCWAAPIVARGLCYVRGAGRLVCLDLLPRE